VVWNSEYEFPVQARASFQGEFVDAASTVVRSVAASARPALRAAFYQGNQTLVLSTPVDESAE
jgi:hypothetical protein